MRVEARWQLQRRCGAPLVSYHVLPLRYSVRSVVHLVYHITTNPHVAPSLHCCAHLVSLHHTAILLFLSQWGRGCVLNVLCGSLFVTSRSSRVFVRAHSRVRVSTHHRELRGVTRNDAANVREVDHQRVERWAGSARGCTRHVERRWERRCRRRRRARARRV
jgi:hypothetical protein